MRELAQAVIIDITNIRKVFLIIVNSNDIYN
jgi:hypothetical protein